MDSQCFFRCGVSVTGAGLSDASTHTTLPSLSSSQFGSLKADRGNSPNSPFSSHHECDTVTTLSDSQDQYSSTENISGVSAACNSSLEGGSSSHRLSPSQESHQDNPLSYCRRTSNLCNVNCNYNIRHALREVETARMGPDYEEMNAQSISFGELPQPQKPSHRSGVWRQHPHGTHTSPSQEPVTLNQQSVERARIERSRKIEETLSHGSPRSSLKQLLIECARALSENYMADFEILIERVRDSLSISGEPIQRLGAYMVEGLVARKEASGTKIYRALRCKEPEGKELLSYMRILYEICPYLKFGYMAANGAIAEACRNEDHIHIVDFQVAQGTQWLTLLQALAQRPGGPPHVRITGIDDPVSKFAGGDGLEVVGRRLRAISEKFNIPIEFQGVPVFAPDVTREMIEVRPRETLAVNFPLQLHHTPDESVDVNNPRDGLLRMVKSLSPKVVTLVEQESNANTTPFLTRFIETLDYYLAVFESIDVALPRDSRERINVEQHCLARDIVNIIACEGKERVERHELIGKWKSRLTMAGFQQRPLSSYVNSVIKRLLKFYLDDYTLEERDGAILLGWKERKLISASAWY